MNGKSGTVTPEEFELMEAMVEEFGPKLLVQKVAKICNKNADLYAHEYPSSTLATAWKGSASKITGVFGSGTTPVSKTAYSNLGELVMSYGPELIVQKIGKLAARVSNPDASRIKSIFPKVKASVPSSSVSSGSARRSA